MGHMNRFKTLTDPKVVVSDAGRALMNETFFSTKDFVMAWCRSMGNKDRPLAIPVRGSGPPRTVYTIQTAQRYWRNTISSGHSDDFCLSPGWDGQLERHTLEGILKFLMRPRTSGFLWKVRFDHEPLAAGLTSLGLGVHRQSIHVLHLRHDYEHIFAAYNATIRNHTRKARRRGLRVRDAQGVDEIATYHEIYVRVARQKYWAFIYPPELSIELVQLPNAARFLVAEYEGRIIGGGLFVRDGNSVMYLHGVNDRDYTTLYPSCAVIDEAIRWACESGAAFMNLGNSGTNKTLAQFKSFWGAQTEYNWIFEWRNPLWAHVSGLKAALGKSSILRRLSNLKTAITGL